MTGLTLAVALQALTFGAGESAYAKAKKVSAETGKPVVALVGAEWCPGCRTMKTAVIPELQKRGAIKDVVYLHVDTDHDDASSNALLRGNSIPQLVVVWKGTDGWKRSRLIGAQSAESVHRLIKKGVKLAAAGRDADTTVRKAEKLPDKSSARD